MKIKQAIVWGILLVPFVLKSQGLEHPSNGMYWQISERNSIVWDVNQEDRLPHQDNIEMAGKQVAAIIYYEIDEERRLKLKRDVIFPQLRTFNKTNEPDWKKYRAYFRKTYTDDFAPSISFANKTIVPDQIDSVEIGGWLRFYCTPVEGIKVTKTIFPSMEGRYIVEEWEVQNTDDAEKSIGLANCQWSQTEKGYKGDYTFQAYSAAKKEITLDANETYRFPVYYGATLNEEKSANFSVALAKQQRWRFLEAMQNNLALKTPDDTINTLFYFAKIRAAESIFDSSMGLVHSPGGGNYYAGIWANDQIEYSGPFFPTLGYTPGNMAAYNAYKMFLENIPEEDTHLPYAFEVDGNFPMTHLDRGDAAMTAYGTAHYLLTAGNRNEANELWPLIEWCLTYCHDHRNESGAVVSESDEMEGRIETGTANLSTSSLYYGGLKYAIPLARELGENDQAAVYETRLAAMEKVIENYFGASLEGLETYKYFAENKYLRHWICLPLTMGITTRKEGTLTALFEKLWTDNGILVELDPNKDKEDVIFWDRATLYALRGALKTGAVDIAYDKLKDYSRKRLLSDHVPYPIEAYPENNRKHLSAESALYCRIFTEGLLGIEPLWFHEVKLTPRLPEDWDKLALTNIYISGIPMDIFVTKSAEGYHLQVTNEEGVILDQTVAAGESAMLLLEE